MKKLLSILLAGLVLALCVTDASAQSRRRRVTRAQGKKVETAAPVVDVAPPAPVTPQFTYRHVSMDSLDYDSTGYNPLSIHHINYGDVMYRLRMERRIPLEEKCNRPFNNEGFELMTYLVDALLAGKLTAYDPDSLNRVFPVEYINSRIISKDDFGLDIRLRGKDLKYFDMIEDMLFDRRRSMTVYDIHYFIVAIPDGFAGRTGAERIAAIRYVDAEKYFNTLPTTARWKNPYNNKENRTFPEAFRLRLFCGVLQKIDRDNPTSVPILAYSEVGGNQEAALLVSQRIENELISWENELYEY